MAISPYMAEMPSLGVGDIASLTLCLLFSFQHIRRYEAHLERYTTPYSPYTDGHFEGRTTKIVCCVFEKINFKVKDQNSLNQKLITFPSIYSTDTMISKSKRNKGNLQIKTKRLGYQRSNSDDYNKQNRRIFIKTFSINET